MRIAVGGISQEANDFTPAVTDLSGFAEAGFLAVGEEVLRLTDSGTEIAGALDRLGSEADVEPVPLLAARGISPGRVSSAAYDHLLGELRDRLRSALPVDGVYLFLHGSMEAGTDDDPEGTILAAVRELTDAPLVVSCDLHANVTRRMVEASTAVVGYKHYPHDDVYDTGRRSAELLLATVRGDADPVMAHAKLDMILTAFNSTTREDTPYARLQARARELEARPDILSASVFFVGSYIDTPDMGCSVVVIADGRRDLAITEARRLALEFWEQRTLYDVDAVSVAEAVRRARQIQGGPVLLLDTSDTTGGGGAGDGIGLVRGLLEAGVGEDALAQVVDAAAASACHEAGAGADVELAVGHAHDERWGRPLTVRGRVERLLDGRFRYSGGIFGGVEVSMGPSAVLAIGSIRLLIMSQPTYDWADEQYRAAGLDPATVKFVGVKNMMNFRFGYRDVMRGFFVLDLPGPTPPDMRLLPFARIRRPVFPLDRQLADPGIRVATSRS